MVERCTETVLIGLRGWQSALNWQASDRVDLMVQIKKQIQNSKMIFLDFDSRSSIMTASPDTDSDVRPLFFSRVIFRADSNAPKSIQPTS